MNAIVIDWALISTIVTLAIMTFFIYLKINLKICDPNEILIFSGKKRKLKSGRIVGYRIIKGGWGLRTPILERVSRLNLSTMSLPLYVERVLSNGMIPLTISAIAHVKISSEEGYGLENAVEKLLKKPKDEIETIAKTTIEGILRGVFAVYTPEEANYERTKLEKDLLDKAATELNKLGFSLDSFKIDDIKDFHGYLEAVGRQRNAIVQRDARIKEAESEAEAVIVESESKRKASDSEYKAKISIEEYETNYRSKKAEYNEMANKLEVKASFARSIEELKQKNIYHGINIEVSKSKQEAEVIIPAEAGKKASELKAKGQASMLKEQGIAMAEAVKEMKTDWQEGQNKELFMLHLLPNIVDSVSKVISDNLNVEKLVVMGNGGLPSHVGDVTSSVITFLEKIKTATGVDLTSILKQTNLKPVSKELK